MKSIFMRIIFLYLFCIINAHAFEPTTPQTLSILEKIDQHAMIYGNGTKTVYVFIDPNCPNSQDFITMIYESPKMKETYQYHIFMYELKRMKSSKLIETIYSSANPLHTMFEYMVGHKDPEQGSILVNKTFAKMRAIESAAQQLGVNKRPYLIISKEMK